MPDHCLDIITPKGRKRMQLTGNPVSIGRVKGNSLAIDMDGISREHCVLEKTDSGYQLRDLGSRNGTLVNGQPIKTVALLPGDEFEVGPIRFILNRTADAPASPKAKPQAPPAHAGAGKAPPADSYKPVAPAAAKAGSGDKAGGEEKSGRARSVARTLLRKRSKAPVKTEEVAATRNDDSSDGFSLNAYADPNEQSGENVVTTSKSSEHVLDYDDPIGTLRRLLDESGKKEFGEEEIALVNTRGQIVHEAQMADAEEDADDMMESILLLRLIILAAFRTRASDLHFEPKNSSAVVRMRVDGTMIPAVGMHLDMAKRINGAVKILADIDIAQRNIVQEGHFSTQVPGRAVDYRVSFTPSMYGQKLVLRVLDSANAPQHLEELRLPGWMFQTIRKTSKQSSGMVLVCGPTGSGKTTTLYSVLRDINTAERNVITIEDPVEYQLDGVTQIPADEARGNNFHTLLRSVLRQDPDVILLGEIRDEETAKTAMQASMTGHLVLSTVHAKDSVGTIFRILDLGVEPYLVGSSLNLILAQRLLRELCDNCKAPKKPSPKEAMRMGRRSRGLKNIYYPVGCPRCLKVGYFGRRGLYELLTVNDAIRDVVLNNPTIGAIREALKRTVFTSLEDMAWEYVASGITSVDEVERVATGL